MRAQTICDAVQKGRFVKKGTKLPLSYVELHREVKLEAKGKLSKEDMLEQACEACYNYENDPDLNCHSIVWEYEKRWGTKFYCIPWPYYRTKVIVTYEMWPRKKA